MGNNNNIFSKHINLYTLAIAFNFINIIFYCLILTASILNILNQVINVIIINTFSGLSCLVLMLNEIHCSEITYGYFRFLVTFRGRGLLYIILSFIVYQTTIPFNLITTYFGVSLGVGYFILSFVPHILPLNDLRISWRSYKGFIFELEEVLEEGGIMRRATYLNEDTIRNQRIPSQLSPGIEKRLEVNSGEIVESPNRRARLLPIKGHATLAMEINEVLSDVNYSDFEGSIEEGSNSNRVIKSKTKSRSQLNDSPYLEREVLNNKESYIYKDTIKNEILDENNGYLTENSGYEIQMIGTQNSASQTEESETEGKKKIAFTLRKSPFRKKLPSLPDTASS